MKNKISKNLPSTTEVAKKYAICYLVIIKTIDEVERRK